MFMLNILRWYAYVKTYMAITGIITPWVTQLSVVVQQMLNKSKIKLLDTKYKPTSYSADTSSFNVTNETLKLVTNNVPVCPDL